MLAKAWAPAIRVCGVAPGTVLPEAGSDADSLARAASAAALGRVGSPDDIVGAVRYLVEADYVTGHPARRRRRATLWLSDPRRPSTLGA